MAEAISQNVAKVIILASSKTQQSAGMSQSNIYESDLAKFFGFIPPRSRHGEARLIDFPDQEFSLATLRQEGQPFRHALAIQRQRFNG